MTKGCHWRNASPSSFPSLFISCFLSSSVFKSCLKTRVTSDVYWSDRQSNRVMDIPCSTRQRQVKAVSSPRSSFLADQQMVCQLSWSFCVNLKLPNSNECARYTQNLDSVGHMLNSDKLNVASPAFTWLPNLQSDSWHIIHLRVITEAIVKDLYVDLSKLPHY